MPSLHAAVPLKEMHRVPELVAEDLHLDVTWLLQVPFDEHPGVAKGAHGLPLGGREGVVELGRGLDDAHALHAKKVIEAV